MDSRHHTIKLFTVDSTEETVAGAAALREKYDEHMDQVINFSSASNDCFKDLHEASDISHSLWLGHSNKDEIGDYDCNKFVKKFTAEFKKKFSEADKNKAYHLYILSCELALHTDHKEVLAQRIANKFGKEGFTNLAIHAISNPATLQAANMRVHIITNAGISSLLMNRHIGDVQAFIFSKEQEVIYNNIVAEINSLNERMMGAIRSKRFDDKIKLQEALVQALSKKRDFENATIFLDSNDIIDSLNKPENIFYVPKFTHTAYSEKLPAEKMLRILTLAQQEISQRKTKLLEKNDKHKANVLHILLQSIEREPHNLLKHLESARENLKLQLNAIERTQSSTYKLLKSYIDTIYLTVIPPDHSTSKTFIKKAKQFLHLPIYKFTAKNIPHPFLLHATQASCQLRKYAEQLKSDYQGMDFIRRLVNGIKLKKAAKLLSLADEINKAPQAWKESIDNAMSDAELMKGNFSHNTRNLLINLRNKKFDLYISEEKNITQPQLP